MCNDEEVTELSERDIDLICRAGGYKGAHAYMLLYEKVNSDQQIPRRYFVNNISDMEYVHYLQQYDPKSLEFEEPSLLKRFLSIFRWRK